MLRLERYEVVLSPEKIEIDVNQKKSAMFNIGCSLTLSIGATVYFLFYVSEVTWAYYLILAAGVGWLALSFRALKSERAFYLSKQNIAYQTSGKSKSTTLPANDLSHVELHQIDQKRKSKKSQTLFPWVVKLIDKQELEFKQSFNFQHAESAKRMANLISEFYAVDLVQTTS